MRQLSAMLKKIDSRLHQELSLQASFHGHKLARKQGGEDQGEQLTDEQSKIVKQMMERARLRKTQEFAKRNGK